MIRVLVYDKNCVDCSSFLFQYFDYNNSYCKTTTFKNFDVYSYDNCVIYFAISLENIEAMFAMIKNCDTVFNAYVLLILKNNNFLLNELVTVDTTTLIKQANYYGVTLSCVELCKNNQKHFEDFFYVYDEIEKFETNAIYSVEKSNLKNDRYKRILSEKWNKINKFLKMSAKDMQYSCKNINFKNINSINNIKISSLVSCDSFENQHYVPSIAYDILENQAFKGYNNDFLINYYFDKIYVLYLPRRKNNTLTELHKFGIWNYFLYEGFDGTTNSTCLKEYNDYMQFKPSYEEVKIVGSNRRGIGSVGSWAILKSMYNLLVNAKSKGYNRILVLQDDTIFHKNFLEEFKQKIKNIDDQNWKLLYLGASQHSWSSVDTVHSYYHPSGTTDGAFAVGIHSSVFDDLLFEITKFNMPFDSGALWAIQKKYHEHCYVLYKNIVIADLRSSDLRESRDMLSFSKLFDWELDNYELKGQ